MSSNDEAAAEVELRLRPERLGHGAIAFVEAIGDAVAVLVERQQRVVRRRLERTGLEVEAGERGVARVDPGAVEGNRHRQVDRRAVVEELDVEANEAVGEGAGDVALELAAVLAGQPGLLHALAVVVETADMELPVVAEMGAVVEVEPGAVVVDTAQDADRPALDAAVLGDEVEDRAGRIARRGRRRAAADRLDAGDVVVGLDEGVGGTERDVAEQQDRDAVLLELDELGAARRDRQAADRDVRVTLAARGLGTDTRNVADQVGGRLRRDLTDGFGVDAADRDAGVDLALGTRRAGDDDLVLLRARVDRRGRTSDGGRRRGLANRRSGGEECGGRQQDNVATEHLRLPRTGR